MDLKIKKMHNKFSSHMKNIKIKTFSSCLELNINQSNENYKNKSKINDNIRKSKEKYNIRKVETTEISRKHDLYNHIINSKIISSKSKNKKKAKYKKISSIDIDNNHKVKNKSYHKNINHSQNNEKHLKIKKITNIVRNTNIEVLKIKNPKKNFNITNLNINYPINNIKTIDTENHKSVANNEKIYDKCIFKNYGYNQDEIEINTTNQETNDKSGKYLSLILFNIKKYKKLFLNYKKENDALKNENNELKIKMQDMKDELGIMKDEIELNKQNNKENEIKFQKLRDYIKQIESNYEQKIYNLKELLYTKDQEINKLNKIIENESSKK